MESSIRKRRSQHTRSSIDLLFNLMDGDNFLEHELCLEEEKSVERVTSRHRYSSRKDSCRRNMAKELAFTLNPIPAAALKKRKHMAAEIQGSKVAKFLDR